MAIDAQRDFRKRAEAAGLIHDVRNGLQRAYVEYYETNRRPPTMGDLPFSHPAVRSIEIDGGGALALTLSAPEVGLLRLTPQIDASGTLTGWTCRAETENPQWFPSSCRP